MSEWYVLDADGTVLGPLSMAEVIDRQRDRRFAAGTKVCAVGGAEWREIEAVPELQPQRPGMPAPPQTQQPGRRPPPPLKRTPAQPAGLQADAGVAVAPTSAPGSAVPGPGFAATGAPSEPVSAALFGLPGCGVAVAPATSLPSVASPSAPPPGLASMRAAAPPARSRRGKRIVGAVVAVVVLVGGGLAGAATYRAHATRRACESGEPELRLAACARACEGGSQEHCAVQAKLLVEGGKPADAEALLASALAKSPAWSLGRIELARALQAQGKHAGALAELSSALEQVAGRDPAQAAEIRRLAATSQLEVGTAALKAGKLQIALEALQRASELVPSAASDGAYGTALLRAKRAGEASARLERAIEEGGTNAATFVALAEAYVADGKPDDAQKALDRGIAAQPKDVTLYERLAGLKLKAKKPREAADVLERYLGQDPKSASTYASLLDLLDRRKDAERRLALIDRWRAADPTSDEACLRAGDEIAGRDRPGATATLKSCLDTVSKPDKVYVAIVDLLGGKGRLRGDPIKAHAFLDEEIEKHPDRAVLLDLKAQQFVKQRKVADAEALLDKAIADHPAESGPYLAKARFYESISKPTEAAGMIQTARDKVPDSRDPLLFAVGFHVRQKQFDLIEEDLGRIKAQGASDEEVERLREMSTFTRPEVSCIFVGQGPASASMDQVVPISDVHPMNGLWTGSAVQSGYVVNRCERVTVDAVVDVTFNKITVAQVFIFAQATRESSSASFPFPRLKPGETRPFSASTSVGALDLGSTPLGTLGGFGSATRVTGVSVRVRVTSPAL
jgi:predicted Zn-dependent protease